MIAVVFIAVLAQATVPAQASQAELFGDGVFSTGAYELPPTFSPDGRTAYFTVSTPQYGRQRWILETHRTGSRWSTPVMAPFSGQYDDCDPWFSPDGSQLFFLSKRPLAPDQPPKRDLDIWVMRRDGAGWGPPRHLGPLVNGGADEHYVTATRQGALIIAAVRPDSRNLGDIYEVPYENGAWGEPRNIGPAVNQPETHETTPWVSPDGTFIIFASRGRPDSRGDLDLYVTVKDSAGAWGRPINLGPTINSAAVEYCPIVAPDGYLYFTSTRSFFDGGLAAPVDGRTLLANLRAPGNGLGDTYRVPMREVLAIAGISEAGTGHR